jgi:hypothetical protein
MSNIIRTVIQIRRAHTTDWLANKNVVPAEGEPCFDIDLNTLKIGNGVDSYEKLEPISGVDLKTSEEIVINDDGTLEVGVIKIDKIVQDEGTVIVMDGGGAV